MSTQNTQNWPELAVGLYDKLTGRNAEITYEMKDLEIAVPSQAGENAEHAQWKVNGALTIYTRDRSENGRTEG